MEKQKIKIIKRGLFIIFILFIFTVFIYSFSLANFFEDKTSIENNETISPCKYSLLEINNEFFEINYQDLPIFPEFSNLNCLGKVIDIDNSNGTVSIGSSSLLKNFIELFGYFFLISLGITKKSKNLFLIFIGFFLFEWSKNTIFQNFLNLSNTLERITAFFCFSLVVHLIFNFKKEHNQIEKNEFRSDINFLRFFSVFSVVLYHIENPLFEAGWLGVDIFFVISGYLICNSIVSQINNDGFTFKDFYLRRLNRIMPSLYVVLIFSFLVSRIVLSQKGLIEFNNSFLSVVGLLANYYFRGNNLYTAEPSNLVPLLHTWSLSIEEQFYLLFPLLIFIVYKFKKELVTYVIASLIFYSVFLNLGNYEANDIFYITKFRIWELCVGVFLVFVNKDKLNINKYSYYLGFILVIGSIFYFDNEVQDFFPKLLSLIGVSLIILNKRKYKQLEKIFNINLISTIGLSSYSIYLYHQPVFAFYRNLKENYLIRKSLSDFLSFSEKVYSEFVYESTIFPQIILLIFTFILGIFSYKKIELAFIGLNKLSFKSLALIFSVLLICIFTYLENRKYYSFLENTESRNTIYESKILELENLLALDGISKDIYVVGDSHMDMQNQFNYLSSKGFNINTLIEGNCFYIKNLYVSDLKSNLEPWCKDLHDQTENILSNVRNSLIFYGGILPNYIEKDQFFNGYVVNERRTSKLFIHSDLKNSIAEYKDIKSELDETIKELVSNGNIVIIIYPIPEAGWNIEKISKVVPNFENINLHYDDDYFYDRSKNSFNLYDSIENSNVVKVLPSDIFCNSYIKERCTIIFNGNSFYRDYDHLSSFGNELLISLLIDNLIESLKN
tara:strand:+ start:3643 stop:6165 length:2523 start_codon:yes stop_codon:yes gene_type:complete